MSPLVLNPPTFEAMSCFVCGRRMVAVTRHLMICDVLIKERVKVMRVVLMEMKIVYVYIHIIVLV